MDNFASILWWLYPDLKPGRDFIVQQDGRDQPPRLVKWPDNLPWPSTDAIMAKEAEWLAATELKRKVKKIAFGPMTLAALVLHATAPLGLVPDWAKKQLAADEAMIGKALE